MFRNIKHLFRRRSRGYAAVVFAVVIPPIFLLTGLGFDNALKLRGDALATETAEAAAVVAADQLATDGNYMSPGISAAYVQQIVDQFISQSGHPYAASVVVNGADVTVTVRGSVPSAFIKIVGFPTIPVVGSSTATKR